MHEITSFQPDWASPPGATINDMLEERGLSVADLARGLGQTLPQTHRLMAGREEITREVAARLSSYLGVSPGFWFSREAQYREALRRLAENEKWLKKLPFKDMVKYGWLEAAGDISDKIASCLRYFGVATVEDWYQRYEGSARLAAFRTTATFESDEGAVLAWLRKGEIEASRITSTAWNKERFQEALQEVRTLTREKQPANFLPKLQKLCASCGVAVVIARAPSGCRASGATRLLPTGTALLMLSVRYLSDDHFWFTFFHEAGHLILHDGKELFLEGGKLCSGKDEDEANEFSSNTLVPPRYQAEMKALPSDAKAIMRFAKKIGISPGIVVGQLQYLEIIPHHLFNNLRVRYTWDDD
ncbi:ImmA/IrrE family metallo-endopeptidase [Chitinivorax sp. B]|uniref:ImmA/IrrE family metallo-endopeptidase n=1 Tax=Chitinivorax sp. B TaxID=2502235 RepID=UPI0010F8FEE5|nr:ImmA/IrrE family metallo-endopeptidase [Chitinivorax sp. B]